MLVDQGSALGPLFISIGAMSNVDVQRTGIGAHSSLEIGERYHLPLWQTYRKKMTAHPTSELDVILALSVKEMNNTLGPEGLVPTALVFGEYPPVHTKSETPNPRGVLASRAEISNTARQEMEKIMAEIRVKRALQHATPYSANNVYSPGDQVLLWREKQFDIRIGEWMGPFNVVAVDEEKAQVFVQDIRIGQARQFNIVQVKRYHQPEKLSTTFMSDVRECGRYFGSPEDEEVYLTEIISKGDNSANLKEMTIAKRQEIKNLLERGTFKDIPKEDIPKDCYVIVAIAVTVEDTVLHLQPSTLVLRTDCVLRQHSTVVKPTLDWIWYNRTCSQWPYPTSFSIDFPNSAELRPNTSHDLERTEATSADAK